jgi:CheY-like chemotaxis protein
MNKNRNILVVDDEQHMVRLMEYNLKKEGYIVDKAFNGLEAIQKVEEKKPDLILLDIKMPVMNGYEVAVKLKENPETSNIPIIIVSVIADREEIASLQVTSHLAKPFDPIKLVNEVKMAFKQGKGGDPQ